MVTVFLRGGLGNQMFQYAAGLSLAKKYGTSVAVDTVAIQDRFPRPHFTYRTFDIPEVFTVTPTFTVLSRIAGAMPIPGVWLGFDLLFMNLRQIAGRSTIIYQNESKGFNPSFSEARDAMRKDIVLYGRWESEKYFADAVREVRAAFQFRTPLQGIAADIAREIHTTNSIALHVRRGDFVGNQHSIEVDPSYYARGVTFLAERIHNPHFFVFSDDAAWCRRTISLQYPTTYLDAASAGPRASFHLHLMSLCKHQIIANSTFSWWGAWLNENLEKIVVAPRHWPQFSTTAERDIIPTGWTAL